ncbi:MAG TPA: Na+/H+ antiporter [Ktedonobacterales bacterium]|nr:Na+/H+ antiporter [Ktedonobacterales bacterium]
MSKTGGLDVMIFLELLVAVAVVAAVVRYVRIPYTVALVLAGLGLALLPNTPRVELTPEIILTVFLPVLLFYGAYHLSFTDLRANIMPVTLLAIPGVVVTAALAGMALHWSAGIDWSIAFLFGAIVAATDPVAVLAIFGEVGAPRRLSTIVTAESLFNDGTALVFFTTMVGVATGVAGHGVNIGVTFEQFVLGVAGSLALGVAVGIVGTTILSRIDDALLETTILLIIAYGGFLLATRLGASGPLETVTAGLLLGVRSRRVMSPTTRLQAGATWEFLDFVANSLLFLLVGLELRFLGEPDFSHLGSSMLALLWPLVAVFIAITVARALVVWVVARILAWRGNPFPAGWRIVLTWAGLRGAVALAAALSLPVGLPDRSLLLTLTFLVVLVTLLGQGLTIRPLVQRLGITRKEEQGQLAVEAAVGRLRGLDAAVHELAALRGAAVIDDHLAAGLAARLAERREHARVELEDAYASEPAARMDRERDAIRHLLHVRREAVSEAAASGQISDGVLRELLSEIDHELDQQAHRWQDTATSGNDGASIKENNGAQGSEEP